MHQNINHYKIEEGKNFIKLLDSRDFNPKDIFECGGIVYICTEVDNKPTLIEWSKMKF